MPYSPFHSAFPEIAENETRTVTLQKPWLGLAPDAYTFLEMYCDESGCDCRRVFFHVVSAREKNAVAEITYGWEKRDFYKKWMGDDDPVVIDTLKGPALNLASPQSPVAPQLLDLFGKVL